MSANGTQAKAAPMARPAPHSVEAEEAVLGAVLMNPEVLPEVMAALEPDDFFIVRHRWIYDALLRLSARREAIDYLTAIRELEAHGKLDDVGGPAYLAGLIDGTPTSMHAATYARTIARLAVRRRLLAAAGRIAELAHKEDSEIEQVLDDASAAFLEATARRAAQTDATLGETLSAVYDQTAARYSDPAQQAGLPTGFKDLDALLGGMHPGDLLLVAARTSMGKTTWLLNVALHAAQHGAHVGIFSLEQDKAQLAQRFLAAASGIDLLRLRLGRITPEEWKRFVEACARLDRLPTMHLDDVQGATPAQLRAKARAWQLYDGLDLVIVDYVQRMKSGTPADERNRVQALAEITGGLKDLARELGVPVLAAAQLNRAVDNRQDKRPQLSDLRESGNLEIDTDVVLFLHRDDYYDSGSERAGLAELIVAKHRNGPVGTVELTYKKEHMRFADSLHHTLDLDALPDHTKKRLGVKGYEKAAEPAHVLVVDAGHLAALHAGELAEVRVPKATGDTLDGAAGARQVLDRDRFVRWRVNRPAVVRPAPAARVVARVKVTGIEDGGEDWVVQYRYLKDV
ncbi:MAG: replicative DNA helicase [Anaerolineae bacterium]|nr:replicative DNA helicase [Anaerolineae bacterium]